MPKKSLGILLPEDAIELADRSLNAADCRSRNEFIEAAIRFYAEYLALENAQTIVPVHLQNAIKHAVDLAEQRVSKVLFKHAVGLAMLTEILTNYLDYDRFSIEEMEQTAFDHVRSCNGALDMKRIFLKNQ